MHIKTFFFLLFIVASTLFFLSTLQPTFTLELCGSMCYDESSLDYIKLTSMSTSAIAIVLFVITNHYSHKKMIERKEKEARDRLNIEEIHAELEALRQ